MTEENATPFFYTNVMAAHLGAFDITIDFGLKRPEQREGLEYDKVVTVGMSLGHAKAMVGILESLISQYEERFGVVPAPSPAEEPVSEER